jgi:hypothetical protein
LGPATQEKWPTPLVGDAINIKFVLCLIARLIVCDDEDAFTTLSQIDTQGGVRLSIDYQTYILNTT